MEKIPCEYCGEEEATQAVGFMNLCQKCTDKSEVKADLENNGD